MNCFDLDNLKSSPCKSAMEALISLAKKDEKIVLLTADVAHSTEAIAFEREFPDRFFNVGIEEQNVIAVASGLARVGFKPYVALFSSFASKRALDFIFADVCYPNLPVKILATHIGTSFGEAGPTHHALSDVAIIKSLPNMTVITPSDGEQAREVIARTADVNSPLYIRLNRGTDYVIPVKQSFEIGKADLIKEGSDGYIIASGSCVYEALKASYALQEKGMDLGVANVHTLPQIDEASIEKMAKTGKLLTVEEGRRCGLAESVAFVIARKGLKVSFDVLSIEGISQIGSHEELIRLNGVGFESIVKAVEGL